MGYADDISDALMDVSTGGQRVVGKRGAWPSQRAAISALVLHGASQVEARSAARAAFRA